MALELTPDSLVVMVGASGSGKSWWAHSHFGDTQVVSSDRCRALVSDDEESQHANREAFAVFYTIVRQRMRLGRLTVADSTGLEAFSRARLRGLAAEWGRPAHAVVFTVPLEDALAQNRQRTRQVPEAVLERHVRRVQELVATGELESEGYASIHYLATREARAEPPRIVRPPPPPS